MTRNFGKGTNELIKVSFSSIISISRRKTDENSQKTHETQKPKRSVRVDFGKEMKI